LRSKNDLLKIRVGFQRSCLLLLLLLLLFIALGLLD